MRYYRSSAGWIPTMGVLKSLLGVTLEPAQNPDQTPPKTPEHRQAALANPIKPCSGSCRLNVLRMTMEPTLRMPGADL